MLVDDPERGEQAFAPSRLRLPMPWRRRLIASTRSSRSAAMPVYFDLELRQLVFLGPEIDGAEALPIALEALELRVDFGAGGEAGMRPSMRGELDQSGGRGLQGLGDRAGDLGEPLRGRLVARL